MASVEELLEENRAALESELEKLENDLKGHSENYFGRSARPKVDRKDQTKLAKLLDKLEASIGRGGEEETSTATKALITEVNKALGYTEGTTSYIGGDVSYNDLIGIVRPKAKAAKEKADETSQAVKEFDAKKKSLQSDIEKTRTRFEESEGLSKDSPETLEWLWKDEGNREKLEEIAKAEPEGKLTEREAREGGKAGEGGAVTQFLAKKTQEADTRQEEARTEQERLGRFEGRTGEGRVDEDIDPTTSALDPMQRRASQTRDFADPEGLGAVISEEEERPVFDEGMGAIDSFVRGEEETVEIVEEDGETDEEDEEDDRVVDEDADLTSDATATFILENFGLTSFFLDRDDMLILDPETGEEVNVLQYIEDTGKTNDEEVLGLISQTKWYQDTGPTARAFEREWSIAGKAGREELLDETSDIISREAKKIGLTLSEEDLYALSFNAKMMGMDSYEIREEFVDNWELSFDSEAVQSGNIAALRNKVNQAAGKYMLLIGDDALAAAAESLYLGEATLDGIEAGFRNQAIEQMPELGGLIKQGYTPEMYFSSYKTQAERLLERKIDFMGDDRNMFINLMGGQSDDTYIQKPLTLTQANRYFRGLDEWKYTRNANQEARGMADQIGRMFGAVA